MKLLRHPNEWSQGAIGLSVDDVTDGLLFVMHKSAPWPVDMLGVKFPLDVYWLSDGGMVLEHAELFPGLPAYWPECQAKYVLELPMMESPRYRVGEFIEVPHDPVPDS